MSISNSLANALSGLTAASRGAELVSANVANATTEGYGRRVLEVSAATIAGRGAGVQIDGVRRDVDQALLSDRRKADAALASTQVATRFYDDLQTALGLPDDPASLSGRIAALDAALIEAASRPDSDARLASATAAADTLARALNAVSSTIQESRGNADQAIAGEVETLNRNLEMIADLNAQIRQQVSNGYDGSGLMDQRQVLVDEIAASIPLRVVQQEFGEIGIWSVGGATLLNGVASQFSFTPTSTITADMILSGGALSGLRLNGQQVDLSTQFSAISGGRLTALFDLRDSQAPQAQAELDAVARDLIERFQNPAADATLNPGDAGLFTDQGVAFDAANEIGLAGRIALNAAVDPSAGGALWRLRSGLNAAAPAAASDANALNALASALSANRVPASGMFTSSGRSAAGMSAELLSWVGSSLQAAQTEQGFAASKAESLKIAELAGGVDTDQEMQMLLRIEQAYNANAKVVETLDELIGALIRM